MSSINSANKRNAQDEALRRARETYQEKETDQAKSHSTEMKRMNESHQAELRELQETHNKQMESLKSKASDAISNRDMKYQQEIEDLRGMHQTQLRRQAGEAESRIQKTNQAAKNDIERTSMIKDQQKEVMAQQYETQIEDGKKRFSQNAESSREMVQESIITQREKLDKAHKKEMDSVTIDRDRTRAQSQRNYDTMRKSKDAQIRDVEQAKRTEVDRLSQNHEATIRDERNNTQSNFSAMREDLQDGIQQNRARYEKALEKQAETSGSSSAAFKSSIGERINNRLNVEKAENNSLKNEITRQQTVLNRAKNREVQNTKNAMQANIEDLEKQRLGTVEASNEKSRSEISKMTKKSDDLMSRTNRFYQDKQVTDRLKADDRHQQTKSGLEKRLEVSEMTADDRTNKLLSANAREEENLRGFFDKSTVAQRENYETSLRDLRDKNKRDQDTIFTNFSKQSTDREMKFQAKLTEVNSKFETQIQSIKDEQQKAMAAQAALSSKEKKTLTDQKNGEMQRQASQFENRIAKLEETHKREIDGINRRHEESISGMTRSKGRT